jgi:prophage antirepressor-like protein
MSELNVSFTVPAELNPDNVQVRVAGTHENPLICLADVCRVLGNVNPSQIASRLKDKHKTTLQIVESGKPPRNVLYVTEPGLYRIVLTSRAENAEKFQDWVDSEVLPMIRKTGGYGNPSVSPELVSQLFGAMRSMVENLQTTLTGILQGFSDRLARLEDVRQPQMPYNYAQTSPPMGIREQINRLWPEATEAQRRKCSSRVHAWCRRHQIPVWRSMENSPYCIEDRFASIINTIVNDVRSQEDSVLFRREQFAQRN